MVTPDPIDAVCPRRDPGAAPAARAGQRVRHRHRGPARRLRADGEEYGPIFKIVTKGTALLLVAGPELVDEVCDDARYDKRLGGGLATLREGPVDSGLFTAATDDPLWSRAHNILMAPFSQQAMRDYMPKMLDIADQLMDKWARLNPGEEVDVTADMTRLTLDTIALCGFGYRFNSFYRETPHPFVDAMVRALGESQARMRQLPVQTRLRVRAQRQFEEDEAFMNDLVDGIIAERRAAGRRRGQHRPAGPDAHRRRQATGEGLPDENIRAQCITFLIAGPRDDLGPAVVRDLLPAEEPRRAWPGPAPRSTRCSAARAAPTFEQVHRLTYVRQILDETLRLWPTAPGVQPPAAARTP